jgi:hypothetical protein
MEMHRNESVGVDRVKCTPSVVWVGAYEGEVMLLRGLLLGARDREALLGADSEAPTSLNLFTYLARARLLGSRSGTFRQRSISCIVGLQS